MGIESFLLTLTLGAAVLAAWTIVRFPKLMPANGAGVTVAVITSAAVLSAAPALVRLVGTSLGQLGAVFLIVLPALIFVFLAIAWMMLFMREALSPYDR